MIVTNWCGSKVEGKGRYLKIVLGWLREGWRPHAQAIRRKKREMVLARESFDRYKWNEYLCDPHDEEAIYALCEFVTYHVERTRAIHLKD